MYVRTSTTFLSILLVCFAVGCDSGSIQWESAGDQNSNAASKSTARPFVIQVEGYEPLPSLNAPTPSTVQITSPRNHSDVGLNVIVEGLIHVDDLGNRIPVVGVHPLLTNRIWIQPLPLKVEKTNMGYRFRTPAYCGTPRQGVGEAFEIYTFLLEKGTVREGDQWNSLPDVPASSSVLVRRTR